MKITEAGERANALVAAWIIRKYRTDGGNAHLRSCNSTTVAVDGRDGTAGCDTGCDYVRLEATVTCPHGQHDTYEYGTYGDIAMIVDELERGVDP